jgi:glucose/mannose transport system substrate-binding protein
MKKWVLGAMCTASLLACGGDEGGKDGTEDEQVGEVTIELFSWWSAPGEAQALQALIQAHQEAFPHERIYNAADAKNNLGGVDAKMVLANRLAANDPPDVFQQNAFEVLAALEAGTGKFEQLDDFFAEQGLTSDTVVKEVLDNVSQDGHVYSMPVNIHRENSLFYNMKIFKQHDIAAPKTIDELLAACQKLKAAGVTPFAVSPQSWILGKMWEGLAEGTMTPQKFVDYYTGSGPTDEAALRHAMDVYASIVMDYSNIHDIDESFGWAEATEALRKGEAAMFLHGDWAKGYLTQYGATPGVDFGVVAAPGASDLFVYGVDVFVIPLGAKHRDAAFDFLTTVASPDAQADFNKLKGSTPIRLDVTESKLDVVGKEVLADFRNAKMRVALHGSSALSDALGWFAFENPDHMEYYGDVDLLTQTAIENPPDRQ